MEFPLHMSTFYYYYYPKMITRIKEDNCANFKLIADIPSFA